MRPERNLVNMASDGEKGERESYKKKENHRHGRFESVSFIPIVFIAL